MSKELETLYKLSQIEFETGDYMNDDGYMMKIVSTEMYDILLKSLTPPTADEVCALIEKDIKGKATYSCGQFYIDNEKVDDILFGVFRAKTLIAIGKFYEELKK